MTNLSLSLIIGYIFEKYINQKQMGAYYTKEDITEYISKNTILPFLLDATEQKCQIAFRPDGPVWSLLRENPDAYIYDAVKKGCDLPLPSAIEAGIHDVTQRSEWNKPAPETYALPTETWREVVARRTRYQDLRAKLGAGEITSANDLITHNLDSRRFIEDVITYCTGTDLLRALYDSIEQVTVLDPTCGSGAFLFSALGILEGLYEACLERMGDLVEEREALDAAMPPEKRHSSPDIAHFRAILERVKQHPSRSYFIFKSIIIRNVYGVDIMEEATEICKLRLFLKLVSQVERFNDIEPLPDIDFNIRAGNTLVGFASFGETKQAIEGKVVGKAVQNQMVFDDRLERIEQKAQDIERTFEQFRELQTKQNQDPAALTASKQQLQQTLGILRAELNGYLASEYGIDRNSIPKTEEYNARFTLWQQSHQPFHWWVEFYGIMKRGGFDVIIGNPPWKEYSSVRRTYAIRNYVTEGCGNLYGLCTERALSLRSSPGWMSYIVQLPLASSSRMVSVRNLLKQKSSSLHVITFDDRPGKLFEGLQNCRSVICVSQSSRSGNVLTIATTRYQRWLTEIRETIFPLVEYAQIYHEPLFSDQFPKYANAVEELLFFKIKQWDEQFIGGLLSRRETNQYIFYQEATRYWVKATIGLPYYAKNGVVGVPAHGRFLYFEDAQMAQVVCAILNSSLFYAYFVAFGDCFHLSDTLVSRFPLTSDMLKDAALAQLNQQLMAHMTAHAERKTIRTSDGHEIMYDNFYGAKSKPIIDGIDRVLAKHYDFTDEELDFIINYDIKYRMGRDSAGEEEE